ncbi:PI-PLC X domain-containing protein 3-like isoform X1 [Saccostrea echinata]|uniref:PI-PLC X domain-containing protein 3-like isoform X1 n=1 Tax=Saccostrea echinata TaxID=191078 RepID=UPI002A8253D0|nr:PI-PLC X domain-containing protein 3-like isoform X1 [Saccostrea echinata]
MASYRKLGSAASGLADWMALLPTPLISNPLTSLAIPGSSASFSCTVTPFHDIAPDNCLLVRTLGHLSCCVGKEGICRWSRTQDLSVEQQLTNGVRYFDVQVAARSRTGDFHIVCGLYGDELSSCLKEIKLFLDSHEKEVIIIDINRFYNINDILHMKLLSIITHCFDGKLCPYDKDCDVTLGSLWNKGQQVIVIYHNDIIYEYENFWPGDSIVYQPKLVPNTPADLILQLDMVSENDPRKIPGIDEEKKVFKCCRGIISLSKRKYFSRLSSSRKREISIAVAPLLTSWLKNRSQADLNVITADFVHLSNFVQYVVNLNITTEETPAVLNGKMTSS